MDKVIKLIPAVLLTVTISLPAQDKPARGSRAPDPAAFNDPHKGVKPARATRDTSADVMEIDRVLAEARMHLSRIAEESATCSREAQDVFDEAIELITIRLRDLKKKSRKDDAAGKVPAAEAGGPAVKKTADPVVEPPRAEAPVPSEVLPGEQVSPGKVAGPRASLMFRWAQRLRTFADELEAEANSGSPAKK